MNSLTSRHKVQEPPGRTRSASPSPPTGVRAWALEVFRCDVDGALPLQALFLVDEVRRAVLGIETAANTPPERVIAFVARMIELHGRPQTIRVDRGTTFTSKSLIRWCARQAITLRSEPPYMPHHTAYIERLFKAHTKGLSRPTRPDSVDHAKPRAKRRASR